MKTNFLLFSAAIILLAGILGGCDPQKNDGSVPNVAPGDKTSARAGPQVGAASSDTVLANDPVAGTLDEVKTLSYDARGTLSAVTEKMDRQINDLMARWKAAGRQFPSESEEQYRNTRQVLAEKLNALTFATPETWDMAKEEAAVALQNVRGALHAMDASAK